MRLLKAFAIPLLSLLVLVLSSCGTATTSSPPSSSNAPTPTKTAPTPTPTSNVVVKTATVTVGGKSTVVLTNAQGMTLYYFTPDTATTTACTGGCASNWPPLIASGNVAASTTLPGALATYSNANGSQVIYNGHPLYTFKSDSAPGQANGQGVGGKWFVATPDLAKQ